MAVLFAAAAVAAVSSVIKMCDVMSSRAAAATGNRSARPLSPHQTARAGTRGTWARVNQTARLGQFSS